MHPSECPFCYPYLVENQQIILENEKAICLQLEEAQHSGNVLEGAGVIVTKAHRVSPFDLTNEEWLAIKDLLQKVKYLIDEKHEPSGYNIGWNSGEIAGQHIMHAHMHVLPRYSDEKMRGKGIRYIFKHPSNTRPGNV
ncbi:HIT family protein [Oceanobacillus timonensis]|uniref:HIT family protein n=1 Tax=Oceanobacillus timonensis TaxID=1926285 RepID=UPI0009BBA89F|nr:HIT domain-containing protein [Oceanobacillus timonensis]